MKWLNNISIRRKAILSIVLTVLVILLLGFGFVIYNEKVITERELVTRTFTHAKLIGEYSIIYLVFEDKTGGERVLSRAESISNIRSAILYDRDDSLFVSYGDGDQLTGKREFDRAQKSTFFDDHLEIIYPIQYDDQYYGTLLINIGKEEVSSRIIDYSLFMAILTVVLIIISFVIADNLQSMVTKPILKLVNATERVSQGDYNIMIDYSGRDELSVLMEGFKQMTDQVRDREQELRTLKDNLEKEVESRTAELKKQVHNLDRSQRAMFFMVKDLNELTDELNEERKKLELSNKELEAFTYSVSHDLRAPLRAINGYANFLLEDYSREVGSEGKRYIDVIRKSATKMDELISHLLKLSRVSKARIIYSNVDMKACAMNIYSEIATEEEKQAFEFVVNDLPEAKCDYELIKLVWQNLISNALKYSSKSDIQKIEIGAGIENGMATYWIKDYGAGFNSNYKGKLFGIFQRLHKEKDFEGNGVGLAIVQRLITRHGGKVWAEGEIDKGAKFWFTLPFG